MLLGNTVADNYSNTMTKSCCSRRLFQHNDKVMLLKFSEIKWPSLVNTEISINNQQQYWRLKSTSILGCQAFLHLLPSWVHCQIYNLSGVGSIACSFMNILDWAFQFSDIMITRTVLQKATHHLDALFYCNVKLMLWWFMELTPTWKWYCLYV